MQKVPKVMRARYHKVRVNGIQMTVHRHMMEQFIGRTLKHNEWVHHINGDRYDNRIGNLEIISPGDHSRHHNLGRKHSEETKAKVSRSLIGNQRRKGIPHTPEIKAKISQSMKDVRAKKYWSSAKKT